MEAFIATEFCPSQCRCRYHSKALLSNRSTRAWRPPFSGGSPKGLAWRISRIFSLDFGSGAVKYYAKKLNMRQFEEITYLFPG
jgi:hypothetical protein